MPLDIPDNAQEVELRTKTDVQRSVPDSNPFLKNSWIGALVTGFANRIYDFYIQLQEAIKLSFPDTTEGDFLTRWAAIYGLQILPASVSSGNVVATGTVSNSVTIGTQIAASDGKVYEAQATVAITAQMLSISSITRSGTTATVTTVAANHGLANNVAVDISGANETEYNGLGKVITVIAANQFTYQVSGSPSTPATGTIQADFEMASVPVQSAEFGQDQDQPAGTILTLQSPITGVDDNLYVDFAEIGGGADQETDEELQDRLLEQIQDPIAHFSSSDIRRKAREIAGVTRVFVQEITPAVGQVTIYFMRDNDVDPIPSGSEVTEVKNKILEIKPANTSDSDVIVSAPTPVTTAFTFTALSPNTTSMQAAITANLQQFFSEDTNVAENVLEDAYRSAIFNTIDTETGQKVASFTLSVPSGDIVVASGQIAVLGVITYP